MNQLSYYDVTTQKISEILVAVVFSASVMAVTLGMGADQKYSDFIVGSIAWQAGQKTQDLLVFPFALLAIIVALFSTKWVINYVGVKNGIYYSDLVANELIWWSLPAVSGICYLFAGRYLDSNLFMMSVFGILFVICGTVLRSRRGDPWAPSEYSNIFLFILLTALIPVEIGTVISRLPMAVLGDLNASKYENLSILLLVLVASIALLGLNKFTASQKNIFVGLGLLAQICLPLYYFVIYPARLLEQDGTVSKYETSIWLKIVVAALVVFSLFDIIKRYVKCKNTCSFDRLISPYAIFALLVALKVGNTIAPIISADDYHFGESLIGWFSYSKGFIPYVDYIPPHGIIDDDLNLLFSNIFYDGSAATVMEAGRLVWTALAFCAFYSLYRFTGSIAVAFVCIYFLGGRLAWLYFTPFICIWFNLLNYKRPVRWLFIWFISLPIIILGVPAQGMLLCFSSSFIAFVMLLKAIKSRNYYGIGVLVALVTSMCLLFYITPFGSSFIGAVQYVIENSFINQIAYGVPWNMSWWGSSSNSGMAFEAIRMSWIFVPIALLSFCFYKYNKISSLNKDVLPALVSVCFIMLMIPYTMGRIGLADISRPGLVAIFSWCILFPLSSYVLLGGKRFILIILLVASFGATLGFTKPTIKPLSEVISQKIQVSALKDGRANGLHNIGRGYVDEDQWNRLVKLKNVLNDNLDMGLPYLDLTSRNANYYYLNRPSVLPITAPYNMVPKEQQLRAIHNLKYNAPKIALISADNVNHDGGGLSLRNPYIFRFLLDNYIPFERSGFIFGIHRNSLAESDGLNPQNPQRSLTVSERKLFSKAYNQENLQKIPVAWGKSHKSLSKVAYSILDLSKIGISLNDLELKNDVYKITGSDPQIVFNTSGFHLSGRQAGILRFNFTCLEQSAEPTLQIFWWGDSESGPVPENSLKFVASDGMLYVPLDAYASWYLLGDIKGLRVDLDNHSSCTAFKITNPELLQRMM